MCPRSSPALASLLRLPGKWSSVSFEGGGCKADTVLLGNALRHPALAQSLTRIQAGALEVKGSVGGVGF